MQIEAKSVERIKDINKGLENKIIQLQQKLDTKVRNVKNARIIYDAYKKQSVCSACSCLCLPQITYSWYAVTHSVSPDH